MCIYIIYAVRADNSNYKGANVRKSPFSTRRSMFAQGENSINEFNARTAENGSEK